jgi:hypothetical protein
MVSGVFGNGAASYPGTFGADNVLTGTVTAELLKVHRFQSTRLQTSRLCVPEKFLRGAHTGRV